MPSRGKEARRVDEAQTKESDDVAIESQISSSITLTPSQPSPVAHPDLLRRILRMVDKATLAAAMQVSLTFYEVAGRELYREIVLDAANSRRVLQGISVLPPRENPRYLTRANARRFSVKTQLLRGVEILRLTDDLRACPGVEKLLELELPALRVLDLGRVDLAKQDGLVISRKCAPKKIVYSTEEFLCGYAHQGDCIPMPSSITLILRGADTLCLRVAKANKMASSLYPIDASTRNLARIVLHLSDLGSRRSLRRCAWNESAEDMLDQRGKLVAKACLGPASQYIVCGFEKIDVSAVRQSSWEWVTRRTDPKEIVRAIRSGIDFLLDGKSETERAAAQAKVLFKTQKEYIETEEWEGECSAEEAAKIRAEA